MLPKAASHVFRNIISATDPKETLRMWQSDSAGRIDSLKRPAAAKYVAWSLLAAATLLILGGAFRRQSNMLNTGLLFVSLGLVLAPDVLRNGWSMRLGIGALIVVGGVFAILT